MYREKYLKYKNKYINYKKQTGAGQYIIQIISSKQINDKVM